MAKRVAESSEPSEENSLDKFRKTLTCAVCLEVYTDPKTLPCHHSFCLQCLLVLHTAENMTSVSCPKCRHCTPLSEVKSLPAAFLINDLMGTYNQLNKERDFQKPQPLVCPDHQTPQDIFCETCDQVTCLYCLKQCHHDHDFYSIADSYKRYYQELKNSIVLLKEKVTAVENALSTITERENEIGEQSEAVKQEIRVMEEEMIRAIRESSRQLTREVETVTDSKLKVLSEQKKSAEISLGYLKNCENFVDETFTRDSQDQLLMSKKSILKRINDVTQQIDVDEPTEKADIQLIKNDKSFKAICHIEDIVFYTSTALHKCKVKEIVHSHVKCLLQNEKMISFPLSLKCSEFSLLTVPVSSIECSLITKDNYSIKTTVTPTTHPGVYNIHCSPSTNGRHQVSVQVHDLQLEGTSLVIPFNPYLETVTPVHTIGDLKGPYGVAVSNDGRHVIVTECNGHCVTVLDKEGKKVKSFGGSQGSGNVEFSYPRGIAITQDNYILVTDNHRIQKISMDGDHINSVGGKSNGNEQSQFDSPSCITISPTTGYIYIADRSNYRIQVYSPDLNFCHAFGEKGSSTEGQLKGPFDVAIDRKGLLYVADWGNHLIQVFNTDGKFVARFGKQGSGPGELDFPAGITVDRSTDLVYVTEEYNHRVSIFTSEGQFVKSYGKRGKRLGEFDSPREITFDNEGVLYVCDYGNNRLVMY